MNWRILRAHTDHTERYLKKKDVDLTYLLKISAGFSFTEAQNKTGILLDIMTAQK